MTNDQNFCSLRSPFTSRHSQLERSKLNVKWFKKGGILLHHLGTLIEVIPNDLKVHQFLTHLTFVLAFQFRGLVLRLRVRLTAKLI